MFYAHSTEQADRANWETCAAHAQAAAALAGLFAGKFGAAKAGILGGLMHDLGKFCIEFQDYIAGLRLKGPDHSTAGAREIMEMAKAGTKPDRLIAQLIAHAIAGHHAGLPDSEGGDSSLKARIARTDLPALDPSWRALFPYDATALMPPNLKPHPDRTRTNFQLAFLGRMLLSALVDADFLCTERFYESVGGASADREWPALPQIVGTLIAAFDRYMAAKLEKMEPAARDAPLNRLRGDILAHVRAQGSLPLGVFTLDVPTGGGKTLASLAFALEHAKAHGLDRIVYAIPFTSITEQTAAIFKEVLGEGIVLEHHSALDAAPQADAGRGPDAAKAEAKRRLAAENWAAPVIVTTNVQLFESLFSHRPGRCRKLHNLANAVIVLDECQTIPLHVLKPCVAALDELVRNYGCTIVLCTATQPALLAPDFVGGLLDARELAPEPAKLHAVLRRVTMRRRGTMTDDEIVTELGEVRQGLVIVNSRPHALALYHKALGRLDPKELIHLSTRQTAADRRGILADMRGRLKDELPCRVIATSLIEAGVDVSFPRGWRAWAGLDQMIQAAGRVNREGIWEPSESFVDIFTPQDAKPPNEIAGFIDAAGRVLDGYDDMLDPAAIEAYFRQVYWQKQDGLDRTMMPGLDGRRPQKVMEQFSISALETKFFYRKVGEAFRLIEEGMEPIIVAMDEKPQAVLRALAGGMPAGMAARELQSFVVQVPPRYRRALLDNGHVAFVEGFADQFAVLKTSHFYTRSEGLIWERADELGIKDYNV